MAAGRCHRRPERSSVVVIGTADAASRARPPGPTPGPGRGGSKPDTEGPVLVGRPGPTRRDVVGRVGGFFVRRGTALPSSSTTTHCVPGDSGNPRHARDSGCRPNRTHGPLDAVTTRVVPEAAFASRLRPQDELPHPQPRVPSAGREAVGGPAHTSTSANGGFRLVPVCFSPRFGRRGPGTTPFAAFAVSLPRRHPRHLPFSFLVDHRVASSSFALARVVRVVVVSFPVFFPARHLIIVELRVTARTQRVTPRRPVLPPAGPGVGSPCFSPPAMSVRSLKSPSRDTGPGAPAGLGIGVHPCGRNKCHLVRTALPSRLPGNRMTLAYPRVPPPQATPAPTPFPSHTATPPRHLSNSWTPLPRIWPSRARVRRPRPRSRPPPSPRRHGPRCRGAGPRSRRHRGCPHPRCAHGSGTAARGAPDLAPPSATQGVAAVLDCPTPYRRSAAGSQRQGCKSNARGRDGGSRFHR